MSDLFAAVTCPACGEPVTRYGCAVHDPGAFCRAPRKVTFEIPDGEPVTACRSCGARVVWIVTKAGKKMPVEAEGPKRGESHFAHCRDAGEWRRPR